MNNIVLKYIGKQGAFYLFKKLDSPEVVQFHHVRSDLIYSFDLFSTRFMNKTFKVFFFEAKNDGRVSRIISDLELQDEYEIV
ncbi:MAG: hypothetical protein Crog4KO_02990 [Crocinitomicaceae bacterium]